MRFWISGPRFMGVRPGISIPANAPTQQKAPGAPATANFVYVVRGDHNLTKIGVTTNPRARIGQLKTASAFPIDYAFLALTPGPATDIEQAAHQALAAKRTNGEWFDVTPEAAMAAVMQSADQLGHSLRPMSLEDADKALSAAMTGATPNPPTDPNLRPGRAFLIMLIGMAALLLVGGEAVGIEWWIMLPAIGLAYTIMFALLKAVNSALGGR